MDYWELDVVNQGPSKKRKSHLISNPTDGSRLTGSTDIEEVPDMRHASTELLPTSTTIPSMPEEEYPLDSACCLEEALCADRVAYLAELRSRLEGRKVWQRNTTTPHNLNTKYYHRTRQRSQPPETQQASQCLLEELNPNYFEQEKYKWHSSMEQAPDMSETTWIDPESAQDFTQLFSKQANQMSDAAQVNPDLSGQLWSIPELDGEDSESPVSHSTTSSPNLDVIVPLNRSNVDSIHDFDVDDMFDWEEACAELVDADARYDSPLPMHGMMFSAFHTHLTIAMPHSTIDFEPSTPSDDSPRSVEPLPSCHNCGVTKTPLWRRTPDKRFSLCNACGLYLKQYNSMRPLVPRVRTAHKKEDDSNVCHNCSATKTSLWRKDQQGQVICNACGLYHKLHGRVRPVGMRKEKISRRKRYRNIPPEAVAS